MRPMVCHRLSTVRSADADKKELRQCRRDKDQNRRLAMPEKTPRRLPQETDRKNEWGRRRALKRSIRPSVEKP